VEQEREIEAVRLRNEEAVRHKRMESEQELGAQKEANEMKVSQQQAMNRERAAFLGNLHGLQVDVTRFLTARYQNADRLIRIEGGRTPRLHLHQES
jgi:hypothetical protein